MSIISIEGGCEHLFGDLWGYTFNKIDGEHHVVFTSTVVPKVGDTIVGSVLVPLVGYKINNDPGFQVKHK